MPVLMRLPLNAAAPVRVGTCHCVLPQEWFDRVAAPQADEADMLEFVIEPQPTSRLSCQVLVTEEMNGMEINVPDTQV